MTRAQGRRACSLVALLLLAAAAVPLAADPPRPTPAQGDTALVARAIRETSADTRPPEPSLREWLQAVIERVMGRLIELTSASVGTRRWIARGAAVLATALTATALVMLALLLGKTWRQRLRKARGVADGSLAGEAPPGGLPGAAAWWCLVETSIEAEDLPRALAALWWFVAASLLGDSVQPSWTTRRLVISSGRGELAPLAWRLDALAWGPGLASLAEVRRLADELRKAVT